jgi:hypothetical protein
MSDEELAAIHSERQIVAYLALTLQVTLSEYNGGSHDQQHRPCCHQQQLQLHPR